MEELEMDEWMLEELKKIAHIKITFTHEELLQIVRDEYRPIVEEAMRKKDEEETITNFLHAVGETEEEEEQQIEDQVEQQTEDHEERDDTISPQIIEDSKSLRRDTYDLLEELAEDLIDMLEREEQQEETKTLTKDPYAILEDLADELIKELERDDHEEKIIEAQLVIEQDYDAVETIHEQVFLQERSGLEDHDRMSEEYRQAENLEADIDMQRLSEIQEMMEDLRQRLQVFELNQNFPYDPGGASTPKRRRRRRARKINKEASLWPFDPDGLL